MRLGLNQFEMSEIKDTSLRTSEAAIEQVKVRNMGITAINIKTREIWGFIRRYEHVAALPLRVVRSVTRGEHWGYRNRIALVKRVWGDAAVSKGIYHRLAAPTASAI